MSQKIRGFCRRAVTLIEVVFAIGVILIGLLGLLSILPLAGRRAQDAISLSVGPAIGEQVIKELQARRYLSSGRLRQVPDNTSSVPGNIDPTLGVSSLCIDPIFTSATVVPPPPATTNGYTGAAFPYYRPTHHPLLDPSTDSTNWPTIQPRLTRVGVTRAPASPPPFTSNVTTAFINNNEAFAIAESPDDLFVSRPDDKTLNATFKDGELAAITGGLEYGTRIPKGDFTWFATVNPLPGDVYASISVVVMKLRDRNFTLPTGVAAPSSPQGNLVGERMAYVSYASGFSGGAGGSVHLVAAANTVASIQSDDWVMLSRNVSGTAAGPVVHRWYRVVGVGGDEQKLTTDGTPTTDDSLLGCRLPSGSTQLPIWRHKVLLDGPDWAFGFNISGTPRRYADDSFPDNTYATIVSDVVSVTERVVLLSDL